MVQLKPLVVLKKTAYALLSIASVFLMSSNTATPCSCVPRQKACEYLQTDAVFVGQVVSTKHVLHSARGDKNSTYDGYSMKFKVLEGLRGVSGSEITIETGHGYGDCGTPMPEGEKFLIFAYKNKDDGKLWTGLCSGSQLLHNVPSDEAVISPYRDLIKSGVATIFGSVGLSDATWTGDRPDYSKSRAVSTTIRASGGSVATAVTNAAGSYELSVNPGDYQVTVDLPKGTDFDHTYPDHYQANVHAGACRNVSFNLSPSTRVRGRVIFPPGFVENSIKVVAIPTSFRQTNQFSGKYTFTGKGGSFDLWPLPPGDYYVGVNINSSPKPDAPFVPTYFPGVTDQKSAFILHLAEGEVKQLELPLHEVAKPRKVDFVAVNRDGKPLKDIYVELEDLRHPGDASRYVSVEHLDTHGAGTLNVYAGIAYHLHGSTTAKNGKDLCSEAVEIRPGSEPISVKFVTNLQTDSLCDISDIDSQKMKRVGRTSGQPH